MRLIDADALKDAIMQEVYKDRVGVFVGRRIFKLIDNAPTVEINTNDSEYKAYCKGLEDGKKIARPQGEWRFRTDTEWHYECNQCKGLSSWKAQFCGICGADMRGKEWR